jgi:hypothetical protein
MVNWPKIHLLERRLAWWRGKAGYRRRELAKWKITGDRAHYWLEVHTRKREAAAAAKNQQQIVAIRKEIGKWSTLLNEAEREIHALILAIDALKPKAQMWLAGGWVRPGTPFRMQRQDQGQDFEIPIFHSVVAPGDGFCVEYSSDRPFPNGFGDPYAIVQIESGARFGGETWYIGHANEPIIRPGQHFVTGQPLARLNHSLDAGWGWVEIGKWDGGPHGMGEGELEHWRFAPLWR